MIDKNLSSKAHTSLVAILLCTYNGGRFLSQQLDSLEEQTHQNWIVIVSDDGSTDQSLEILREYQAKWPFGKLTIRSGPQKGFCQNFLSLVCDPAIEADYYAFCDQDDVWFTSKLEKSIAAIVNVDHDGVIPYLYCGRTIYTSQSNKEVGISPHFTFPASFRNALIQSIAGGNTMTLNRRAKRLLEVAGIVDVPSHDWWTYILVTGAGGRVLYDPIPLVYYRQHASSIVGRNDSLFRKLLRLILLMRGRFKDWMDQNLLALNQNRVMLTFENVEIVDLFSKLRTAPLKDRVRLLEVCGLYRQTWRDTVSLLIATVLKRM